MSDIVPVRPPVESVNDSSVAVVEWLVNDGDFIEAGAPLVVLETTKTSFDVPAPASGVVWRVAAQGDDVPVDAVLCHIGPDAESTQAAALSRPDRVCSEPPARTSTASEPASMAADDGRACERGRDEPALRIGATPGRAPRFSERAADVAQRLSVDVRAFEGRLLVRERDVLLHAAAHDDRRPAAQVIEPSPGGALSNGAGGHAGVTPVPLPRAKRVEGDQIRAAYSHTIPSSVTVPVPTDGRLFSAEEDGAPGVFAATLIFESARLLSRYPGLNAYYSAGTCYQYGAVNIGYAVDLGLGLKVVVIKEADRKSVRQILDEKQQLIMDYLDESLAPGALSEATFTITDLSATGAVHVQPVLSERQSAVLGVCAPAPGSQIFNLVLRFDHQVADGRSATAFLEELRDRLAGHEQSLPKRITADPPKAEPECALCLRSIDELEETRHFLVRAVAAAGRAEQLVCTVCLQDWYA
ncbi:MAG: 2-oxo acid dehydrogenase subunit E2 [Acidobacteria bacterium]|nr:2-oxo acid dehydrogenase subunit E2 [Acidobacteriota bacterium]